MFKFILCSVKDTVTGLFSEIHSFINFEQATRWFDGLCSESKISKDLQLYTLGHFDSQTGDIESNVQFIKSGVAE